MTFTNPFPNRVTAAGQCYCGALQIRVALPVNWVAHCHCSQCRHFHGAAFVTWFGVSHGHYSLDESAVTWFRSSESAERGRCSKCGTPMLFRSRRWPDELHIALAVMRESIGRQPDMHVYYADRVSWIPLQPAEPCHATLPAEDSGDER